MTYKFPIGREVVSIRGGICCEELGMPVEKGARGTVIDRTESIWNVVRISSERTVKYLNKELAEADKACAN
jgi:hypothetical protein